MNYRKIIKDSTEKENKAVGDGLETLLNTDILTDDIKDVIYSHFIEDIQILISEYLKSSRDKNASKGMLYCTLETWQACVDDIGRKYFKKNNYLADRRADSRAWYKEELIIIGMEVYEHFCRLYRKQFFIYDCALFLGISRDTLYKLNTTYTDALKKAHTMQESSMRTALASGRSNVTAMAILLNHDYDYTRTTQIVHTVDRIKSADSLPMLNIDGKTKIIDSQEHTNM